MTHSWDEGKDLNYTIVVQGQLQHMSTEQLINFEDSI
jgi:hypothetical protein